MNKYYMCKICNHKEDYLHHLLYHIYIKHGLTGNMNLYEITKGGPNELEQKIKIEAEIDQFDTTEYNKIRCFNIDTCYHDCYKSKKTNNSCFRYCKKYKSIEQVCKEAGIVCDNNSDIDKRISVYHHWRAICGTRKKEWGCL